MTVKSLPRDAPLVTIYTDGACSPNPGPGGYAAVLMYVIDDVLTKGKILSGNTDLVSGGGPETTNNRMEIAAAIVALEALNKPCRVKLYSDSKYVVNGMTSWMRGWKQRGWKTAKGTPVENQELWKRLDAAAADHAIEWVWIPGHSEENTDHAFWNNLVDMVAVHERETHNGK